MFLVDDGQRFQPAWAFLCWGIESWLQCAAIPAVLILGAMTAHAEETWVTVGHAGNPPDKSGLGSVANPFQIMRYEVTSAEYAEFLNSVAAESDPYRLWEQGMGEHVITDLGQGGIRKDIPQCIAREGSPGRWTYVPFPGWERKPVIFVSFYSAVRYANWHHHGGGNSDTETGAYRLAEGVGLVRLPGARVWLPSEDEWYKAAYYQPQSEGGPVGDYWLFPTCSMERPESADAGALQTNVASFSRRFSGILPVGSLPNATSPYGSYDMGGNVWEWTESLVYETKRVLRGGAAAHTWEKLQSTVRSNASPDRNYPDTGFRLARAMPVESP